MSQAVQINGIIGLLSKFSPSVIESLQTNHPEFKDLLKTGTTMKIGEPRVEQDNVSYQKFLAQVSIEGMKESLKLCDQVIPKIKSKLLFSGKLKFFAQIITVVAGASIFTLLTQSENYAQIAKYVSAGLVLVATLLPLSAKYIEGGFAEGTDNLSKSYEELVDFRLQAAQILPMIEFCLKSNFLGPITELTEKSNVLSVNIRNTIQKKTSFL